MDDFIAQWSWRTTRTSVDALLECLQAAFSIVFALGGERLCTSVSPVAVLVRPDADGPFHRSEFTLQGTALGANATRITEAVRSQGLVGADVLCLLDCVGFRSTGQGAEIRDPQLFRLSAETDAGQLIITLATASDAWLPWDLSGVPQPAVHAVNAPRLASALATVATQLRCTTLPGPLTPYARPTAGGAVNLLGPNGEPMDVRVAFEESSIAAPETAVRIAAETPLYVPAHPQHSADAAEQDEIVFELLAGPDDDPVPVAFSSLDLLVERLGQYQPWAAVRAEAFLSLMDRLGSAPVHLDPPTDPGARRWTAADLATEHSRSQ